MKPCYRRGDKYYLLAHVVREGGQFQQPCKALISPGNGPAVTRATGEFLRRWHASKVAPAEQNREIATGDRACSSKGTAQLVYCKLVVGSCQLSTVLQVVEHVDFSDNSMLSKWHIHIGRKDFEDLQRAHWDSDICYLRVNPELGRLGDFDSFTTALRNAHPNCWSYWHMDGLWHDRKKHGQPSRLFSCRNAACMHTAELLMYVHDVLGLPWEASTCAAVADNIDRLSYAHASGCTCDLHTCARAAAAGSLPCLAYAHEHGCWTMNTLPLAACNGSLECLKYADTHTSIASGKLDHMWSDTISGLTYDAVYGSSMPCLVYVREVMGCAWDPEGSECKLAFERGDLELLQYIHSHGGVFNKLCTQFELLCPHGESWLRDSGIDADKKAACLLHMHCYGGCQVKGIWHTEVGSLVRERINARRVAVLLCFQAAGKAHVEDSILAAAHAAMQRVPDHIVREIICAAGLHVLE